MTEIDRHVALCHRRFDYVTQVALGDDLDIWIPLCKIDNRLAHTSGRAYQQYAHWRFSHGRKNRHPALRLCEREVILVPLWKFIFPARIPRSSCAAALGWVLSFRITAAGIHSTYRRASRALFLSAPDLVR